MPNIGIYSLPQEILDEIESRMSLHHFAVCVQLNKSFYNLFIDRVWHTIDLMSDQERISRFRSIYTSSTETSIDAVEPVATATITRNLARIRVLKIEQACLLNLFSPVIAEKSHGDNDSNSTRSIDFSNLDELAIGLQHNLPSASKDHPPTSTIDMQPLFRILGLSKSLTKLTINLEPLTRLDQFEDQFRLLSVLPPSLETIFVQGATPTTDQHSWDIPPMGNRVNTMRSAENILLCDATVLDRLTTLRLAGAGTHIDILLDLVTFCPYLQELSVDDKGLWDDFSFAHLIAKGAYRKGWKTLGFMDSVGSKIGPLTLRSILAHSATLENLRLSSCRQMDSAFIQRMLSSAPKLKRFDVISSQLHGRYGQATLLASNIIQSEWVCLELETFKCRIGGIPRPELNRRKNGELLTGEFHNPREHTAKQSRDLQIKVLAQLGRLTQLREITLGQCLTEDTYGNDRPNLSPHWENGVSHHVGYGPRPADTPLLIVEEDPGQQYQCLSMALDDGLYHLKDLKQLRRLWLEDMSLKLSKAEQTWMLEHWPDYGQESRDTFWTDRGHQVHSGPKLVSQSTFDYDWW